MYVLKNNKYRQFESCFVSFTIMKDSLSIGGEGEATAVDVINSSQMKHCLC